MKVRACSMGVMGINNNNDLTMNTGVTGVSKVRFSVPSMEFVWETDPHDGKKVTFLVGVDGEPVVLVLGSEDGDGSDDVDQLLQERARRQADLESDILKRAAEEELDKLVRLSRSTVQAMEEEAIKNISKEHDPAREAVVRSLQEATVEMEGHIQALQQQQQQQQEKSHIQTQTPQQQQEKSHIQTQTTPQQQQQKIKPNRCPSLTTTTTTTATKMDSGGDSSSSSGGSGDSSPSSSLSSLSSSSSLPPSSLSTNTSSLPPSSLSTTTSSLPPSSLSTTSSSLPPSLPPSSLSTTTSSLPPSLSSLPPSPPSFSISSYGNNNNNFVTRKLSGLSIWDINNKSDISSVSSVPSNLSSIPSTLPSNPSTLPSNPSTLSSLPSNPSIPSTLSSLPSTLSSVPSTLPSNSSTLPSLPSTLSSDTSFLPPPPSSLTILEGREEEEEEDRSQLSSPPTSVMGVAAQIRRFEQLSEGSLEALKTATLERARRRRQKEILEHLRSQVVEVQQQHLDHRLWQEQERKAKEAERRIREIARRAREEHRRTSIHTPTPSPTSSTPTTPTTPNANTINGYSYSRVYSPQPLFGQDINGNIKSDDFSNNNLIQRSSVVGVCVGVRQRAVRPPKPPSRAAIVTWFRDEELPKGAGLDPTHTHIAPWFHGIISRTEAEDILLSIGDVGSFLVRVSERIWGYAISYRAHQRCRHYLIDVTGGRYTFFGSHASAHRSLSDLVEFHKREAITSTGGELLTQPCGQPQTTTTSSSLSSSSSLSPDYLELFTGTPYMST